jgi:demethylmenaquinone methyltransferase/2-methoxy-6-polyprenyl-1,4-benzoquinol methylase
VALTSVDKNPVRIAGMFDAIAPRYDLLNHLLSAGRDRRWRARAIHALDLPANATVVDLCTGTADLAIEASQSRGGVHVLGVDFAEAMLRLGLRKLKDRRLDGSVTLVRGDATAIPVRDGTADAVTIGFGIRNVADPTRALFEIARALKPGGRLAILEFGQPRLPGLRNLYAWYFRYVLPAIGRAISKHDSAYSYLPASVGEFPPPAEFADIIAATGFSQVRAVPLTLGIVYLFVATRSADGC